MLCITDSEDKSNHAQLAQRLALVTECAVAVPNYRLTPQAPTAETALHHPAHTEDVLAALEFLITWSDPPAQFDHESLYLAGHSCGAHILTCIFLNSTGSTPSITPSPALLAATKGIALSEGIYDIDLLLVSFPEYKDWFIANTFGDQSIYTEYSTTNYPLQSCGEHINWLIVHSKGDSLVDVAQSKAIYDHLLLLSANSQNAQSGTHLIQRDWDTLTMEHNDMLKTAQYTDLVGNFINNLQSKQ